MKSSKSGRWLVRVRGAVNAVGAMLLLCCLTQATPAHAQYAVIANADANQSIPSSTVTVVKFAEVKVDSSGWFSSAERYTPRQAGLYRLSSIVAMANASGAAVAVYVYKNGSLCRTLGAYGGGANGNYYGGDAVVLANGSTDYFDIRVWHNAGSPVGAFGSSSQADVSQFSADYIGKTSAGTVAATADAMQTIHHGTLTTVAFGHEEANSSGWFHGGTGRYQPLTAGYYRISSTVAVSTGSGRGSVAVYLYKNGVLERTLGGGASSLDNSYVGGSAVVYANGASDYFEVKVWQNSGGDLTAFGGAAGDVSQFSASLVPNGRVTFAAYPAGNQTVPASGITKMDFGAKKFDPSSVFDTATGTFVAPHAGFYRLSATLTFEAGSNSAAVYPL